MYSGCLDISNINALGGVSVVFMLGMAYLLYRVYTDYFFGRRYFLISLCAMTLWLGIVFLELTTPLSDCKIFWAKVSWPLIVIVPTSWTMFLATYCYGTEKDFGNWHKAFLYLVPVLAAVAVGTNDYHALFYGEGTLPFTVNGFTMVHYDHGPLFYAFAFYLYTLLAAAITITLHGALQSSSQHRSFFISLFFVTIIPAGSNLLYIGFGVTLYGFDPTPFAFSIVLFLLFWMIAENKLMDVDFIAKGLLFHHSSDPIIVFDTAGRLVGMNPEAKRVFTVDPTTSDIETVLHPQLQTFIDGVISSQGQPTGGSIQIRHRYFDPDTFPVTTPIGMSNTIIGWASRLHDTTERRFLLNALQAERDFLARLTETSMSGILVIDAQGTIAFINSEAEHVLGIQGIPHHEINFSSADWAFERPNGGPIPGLDRALPRLLNERKPLRDRRISLIRRNDGERRIISINASLLDTPDTSEKVVIALADVTEHYRTEARLRVAAAKSESESRSKSQFLANMSHEIRTPLNGVLGMAEVLDRLIKEPEQKRMITTIRHSGELLLTILNDVLDMSKIESGKLDLEATIFRPDHLAARIEQLFATGADEKGLDLEVYTSGRCDIPRIGDPHRIMQILQNLVSNAIKFTHEGEIVVTLSCPPGKPLVIEVRDTGIGMTPEQSARIFNAFEQADGSVTRRFGGTGLGMSIVAKLVEIMQGTIAVETQIGQGTAIKVSLPLEEA